MSARDAGPTTFGILRSWLPFVLAMGLALGAFLVILLMVADASPADSLAR
ncbi:MAG: hypothetical protein JNJ59_13710, partial [Deltaproteobacteria bacterium]|nr:hypothetical protein [Deltaproteobacteria bacterium]